MSRMRLTLLLVAAIFISSCLLVAQPTPTPNSVGIQSIFTVTPSTLLIEQDQTHEEFVGRVIDMDGNPIGDANVSSRTNTTKSDLEGWFKLPAQGLPEWIRVSSTGFISRTRAASPSSPVLFRLTPDDGKTTVLHFVGDTMFGRRFFDPNADDYTADGLLPLNPTVADHMKLLAPIQPLLENADFTVVNLETTLTEQPYFSQSGPRPAEFHPTSNSVYASSTNAVMALKQAGVDIVDLGNNHMYDLLEPGLDTSLSALDQAQVLHFGAGKGEANAWAPVILNTKSQTIALIGCTTLRIPLRTPGNDIPYVASDLLKKGGAAYCSEARLRAEIIAAKKQADMVLVMIHGGQEYSRTPTLKISYLTEIARQAGATLVINHQPHVVGGFSWKDQSLAAWTMGSFLTDQTVWPTFESYLLAVYVREGKIIRAYVEPLMLDGFIPHGLTDELADYVVRGAAGRVAGPFVMESGAMEADFGARALQTSYTQTMDGGAAPGEIIALPQAQWISGFKGKGKLLLGRDLLWVGGFENEEVDSASHGAPLWDLSLGNVRVGQDYAYENKLGIRLKRGISGSIDVVTTNLHRVFVDPNTNLSITGMIRINQGSTAQVQMSWYSATTGPSFLKDIQPIEVQAYDTWQPFRFDVKAPATAVAVGVYLRLPPPNATTVTADFDNIRIIEWAKPQTAYSPLYNYALLTGPGDLTFTQEILPGAEQWLTPHLADQTR